MKQVIVQIWTETEAGWGQRPDGYTIHLTEDDRLLFVEGYSKHLQEIYGDNTPSEYSFPDGDAYVGDVDDKLYVNLVLDQQKSDSSKGIWGTGRNLPPKHKIRTTYETEQ